MFLLPLIALLLFVAMPLRAEDKSEAEQVIIASDFTDRSADYLTIPASTAYIEPNAEGADVTDKGIRNWKDPAQSVNWYGCIKTPGWIGAAIKLTWPFNETATMRLSVAGQSHTLKLGIGGQTVLHTVFLITTPGYYKFTLEGIEKSGATFPEFDSIVLHGAKGAQFNLKPRRNAASVHLGYPTPPDWKIEAFYNEVTPMAEPVASYYMAAGFSRGYFGMQVNSPTERRIIFSIWDSGGEAVDRTKVKPDDMVQLLGMGDGVYTGGFGNEGTGGHSHLVYPWQTGQTYRFLVTVKPDGTHTIYSGYFYFPEKQAWGLIASFRAPKDGNYLSGLYSFNENFGGANGQLRRLAMFGPQWVKTSDGAWHELTTARFTHDPTGQDDRHDYSAGAIGDKFYLSNGGFTNDAQTVYKSEIQRTPSGKAPEVTLPEQK